MPTTIKPRFSTLLNQAEQEVLSIVSEYNVKINDLIAKRDNWNNPNGVAAEFFASGMSLRIYRDETYHNVANILNDKTGQELTKYLSDNNIVRPSQQKNNMLSALSVNPSFYHEVFVEGYRFEDSHIESLSGNNNVGTTSNVSGSNNTASTSSTGAQQIVKGLSWNEKQWLQDFNVAKRNQNTHQVRIEVWNSTLNIVKNGRYMSQSGNIVVLPLNPNIEKESFLYSREIPTLTVANRYNTIIAVHSGDCLGFAKTLHDKDNTDDLCVLNLASHRNPGGGVIGGAGAQEEYLFRCSDYYRSLYQFATSFDCQAEYGIKPATQKYPLDLNYGGAYSHGVTVFRDTEDNGYALIDDPWHVNFVAAAVPRLNGPQSQIPSSNIPIVENTIRTILRIAYVNGQRRLVLGALGCGAFRNPPQHMAQIFKQILSEAEFNSAFKEVYFAIKDDHNAARNGVSNVNAFINVFGNVCVN